MVGVLVAVDQGFVKIQEYGLEVGVLARKLDVLAGIGYLDAPSEPQYLNHLIKMLPEEVHHVAGLMLLQAPV